MILPNIRLADMPMFVTMILLVATALPARHPSNRIEPDSWLLLPLSGSATHRCNRPAPKSHAVEARIRVATATDAAVLVIVQDVLAGIQAEKPRKEPEPRAMGGP